MVSSQSFSCIGRWRGGFPGAGVSLRAARIKYPRAPRPQLHCERAEAPHRTPQYDWAIFAFAGAVGAHVLALIVTLGPSVVLVRHSGRLRDCQTAHGQNPGPLAHPRAPPTGARCPWGLLHVPWRCTAAPNTPGDHQGPFLWLCGCWNCSSGAWGPRAQGTPSGRVRGGCRRARGVHAGSAQAWLGCIYMCLLHLTGPGARSQDPPAPGNRRNRRID